MSANQLLTVKEVSELLNVHSNTVRAMAEDGRLEGVKTKGDHGHWRFSKNAVNAYLGQEIADPSKEVLSNIIYMVDEIPTVLLEGEKGYSNETLWENVKRFYGIRSIFGSIAIHAEMEIYRSIIDKKSHIWLGEGAVNIMDYIKNEKPAKASQAKIFASESKYAYGVVKAPTLFGLFTYVPVPLLVVTDNQDQAWVVAGTLQQFFPELDKGLVILPLEKAKQLFVTFKVFKKEEFADIYDSETYINQLINEAETLDKNDTAKVKQEKEEGANER